jgi:hypothetical protein
MHPRKEEDYKQGEQWGNSLFQEMKATKQT